MRTVYKGFVHLRSLFTLKTVGVFYGKVRQGLATLGKATLTRRTVIKQWRLECDESNNGAYYNII